MAESIIQTKRSSVSGKIPSTADLLPGEFGINTTDGKVYIEKSAGITTVVAVNPWNVGIGSTSFDMHHLNGRVAIGSDSAFPTPLSVGDVDAAIVTRRGCLSLKTIPTTSTVGDAALYIEEQNGSEGWYVSINSLGDMLFSNSGSSTFSVEFIDATDDVLIRKGNLGILTTTSTNPLTIVGNTKIIGVTTITDDFRVGVSTNEGVVLTSANASKYRLYVSDAGVLSTSPVIGPGQILFTTPGTTSWTCPVGVTSVCVVCVGGGGGSAQSANGASGAGGGGLGWKNYIPVTPGNSYTVVVGGGGAKATNASATTAGTGGTSYFIDTLTVAGHGGKGGQCAGDTVGTGGTYLGGGGGNGGDGGTRGTSTADAGGGGGAGGYSGNGGAGGAVSGGVGGNGSAGSGGGGGGGGGCGSADSAGCGGGVGLYGEGTSGNGGAGSTNDGAGGFGGSGGGNAAQASAVAPGSVYSTTVPSRAGLYGGGGCGSDLSSTTNAETEDGAAGAVRIIWGDGRFFPSTNTTDV